MITPASPFAVPAPARRTRDSAAEATAEAIGEAVAEAISEALEDSVGRSAADDVGEEVGEAVAEAVLDGEIERTAAPTLTAAVIEGIVVSIDVDLVAGTETFDNTLLLKDGHAWIGLGSSFPLSLRAPTPNERLDTGWTRWREVPDRHGEREVLDAISGAWKRLVGRLVEPASATPENLSGTYTRSRTRADGTVTTTRREELRLALDGTFSRSRSVLVTAATPLLSGTGVPTVVHVPAAASEQGRLGGTYALLEDGFTFELANADGTIERGLLLDEGSSRVLDGRRHEFFSTDIDSIDPLAIAASRAAGERRKKDWRSVIAEAAARDGERRESIDTREPENGVTAPSGGSSAAPSSRRPRASKP